MKTPKTIKGYIALLKRVSAIPLLEINGYNELDREEQVALGAISADIDNGLQEFERQCEFTQQKRAPVPDPESYHRATGCKKSASGFHWFNRFNGGACDWCGKKSSQI